MNAALSELCFCSVFLFIWINTGWSGDLVLCNATHTITYGTKIRTLLMLAVDANILKVLCRKSLHHGITIQKLFVFFFITKSFGGDFKEIFPSNNELKVFVGKYLLVSYTSEIRTVVWGFFLFVFCFSLRRQRRAHGTIGTIWLSSV